MSEMKIADTSLDAYHKHLDGLLTKKELILVVVKAIGNPANAWDVVDHLKKQISMTPEQEKSWHDIAHSMLNALHNDGEILFVGKTLNYKGNRVKAYQWVGNPDAVAAEAVTVLANRTEVTAVEQLAIDGRRLAELNLSRLVRACVNEFGRVPAY